MTGRSPGELLSSLLDAVVEARATDLHLSARRVPVLRVDGKLAALREVAALTAEDLQELVRLLLGPDVRARF
jgi:Tfp pilus assembly pilus retraction ATPase PilT